jgi:hypothetical protein
MLLYKNYQLAKPGDFDEVQLENLIIRRKGSVFHELKFNRIIEEFFNTELFYLVDNIKDIQHAAVVHLTRKRFGLKQYSIKPPVDIPYAGFVGDETVDFKRFKIGLLDSFSYVGFPYRNNLGPSDNVFLGETGMIDLTLDEDEILNSIIHSKRRNMIRKAISMA